MSRNWPSASKSAVAFSSAAIAAAWADPARTMTRCASRGDTRAWRADARPGARCCPPMRRGSTRPPAQRSGLAPHRGWRKSLDLARGYNLPPDTLGDVRTLELVGFEGPASLQLGERPETEPGPGEVRVRFSNMALNHLDVFITSGLPKRPLPAILGSDGAGVIDAIGAGVARGQVGDEVVAD